MGVSRTPRFRSSRVTGRQNPAPSVSAIRGPSASRCPLRGVPSVGWTASLRIFTRSASKIPPDRRCPAPASAGPSPHPARRRRPGRSGPARPGAPGDPRDGRGCRARSFGARASRRSRRRDRRSGSAPGDRTRLEPALPVARPPDLDRAVLAPHRHAAHAVAPVPLHHRRLCPWSSPGCRVGSPPGILCIGAFFRPLSARRRPAGPPAAHGPSAVHRAPSRRSSLPWSTLSFLAGTNRQPCKRKAGHPPFRLSGSWGPDILPDCGEPSDARDHPLADRRRRFPPERHDAPSPVCPATGHVPRPCRLRGTGQAVAARAAVAPRRATGIPPSEGSGRSCRCGFGSVGTPRSADRDRPDPADRAGSPGDNPCAPCRPPAPAPSRWFPPSQAMGWTPPGSRDACLRLRGHELAVRPVVPGLGWRAVAMAPDPPGLVAGFAERERRPAGSLEGLEGGNPEQVLLQRPDEPLGAAGARRKAGGGAVPSRRIPFRTSRPVSRRPRSWRRPGPAATSLPIAPKRAPRPSCRCPTCRACRPSPG